MLKNGFGSGGVIARTLPNHGSVHSLIPESIVDSPEKWMSLALLEGMNGIGWAAPNPAVGCLIVKDEKILATGFTQAYGGFHAERMAFESLEENYPSNSFQDLTVYVTLEPCSHTGKQPPCVDLLLHPSIKKVVIACGDPDPRVNGRGIDLLKKAGKEVMIGILKDEAEAWHFPFLRSRIMKNPLWIGKWAENRDGQLADGEGNSKWITNEASRSYTHWLRQKYDAILVGAGTWLRDHPKLTARDCALPHRRNPAIIIYDPKKRLGGTKVEQCFVFQQSNIADFISAVHATDFGFELQSIFCEGGAHTLNELFSVGRIDLVHRFIGQKDLGASKHCITAFNPDSSWKSLATHRFGNDLLQEWVKWF